MLRRPSTRPVPPADTGKVGGKLLGMVTTRDWDLVTDLHTPLSEIMTTDLETAQYGEAVLPIPAARAAAGCRRAAVAARGVSVSLSGMLEGRPWLG